MTINRKLLVAGSMLAMLASTPVRAQTWTVGPVTPVWVDTPTIGQGLNNFSETFTSTQGGDPPALAYETAPIDQNNYTRSQWVNTDASTTGQDEGKLRITCEFSGFGMFDSILAYGGTSAHHHTFFGAPPSATANFTNLRNLNAKTTCAGGPNNRTSYWATTWLSELPKSGVVSGGVTLVKSGVTRANQPGGVFIAPRKPNLVTFYYQADLNETNKLVRLFNGMSMIFGVNPADPKNLTGLAEIAASGGSWAYEGNGNGNSQRYNGWVGWSCFSRVTGAVHVNPSSDADINPQSGLPRQWLNSDGSDPWYENGVHKCDSTPGDQKILIPELNAYRCWDGTNLTAPNGRGNWRQAIVSVYDQATQVCPDHWFLVPAVEVKEEYPALTHALRQRSYLSSDRMDPDPNNWLPNGSTMHADLITAWDSVIRDLWHRGCLHMSVNGTTIEVQACNGSTVAMTPPTRLLVQENAPDTALGNSPVVTFHDYGAAASKDAFGKPLSPATPVSPTGVMHH